MTDENDSNLLKNLVVNFSNYQASGRSFQVFLLNYLLLEYKNFNHCCDLIALPYYRLTNGSLDTTTVHSINIDDFQNFKKWVEVKYPGMFVNFKKKTNNGLTWIITSIEIEGVINDDLYMTILLQYY